MPRADPQTGDGDSSQAVGLLRPCCNGGDLRVVALVEESQAALGYLVLKEQWRTRGNRDLGFFQGFLMNAMRKMEKITFLSLFCGAQDAECVFQKGSVMWNTLDTKRGCYFKLAHCFVFSSFPLSFINC